MPTTTTSKVSLALLTFSLAACAEQGADNSPELPITSATVDSAVYAQAVANPQRTDADRARDANRRPGEVLRFFGIAPSMTVLDLFSGGGYYTELIAHVVGEDGHVIAHSNQAYLGFVGDEFNARYADNRLANAEVLMAENNSLVLEPGRFDAILMVLSYHDIYYSAPQQGWPTIDGPKLLAELHKGLKPGGILGIVDHYAATGAPRDTGGTLHRIDPDIVIAELHQAGFELDGKSDLLRNPDDDHAKGVFDPSIRGNTDRFVLRFLKPE